MKVSFKSTLLFSFASLLVIGCDSAGEKSDVTTTAAVQDFSRSADALLAKLGAPGEKAEMPAPTDPTVRSFEEQAAKALTALGTPEMPLNGLESFDTLCGKTTLIAQAYVSAGAGANRQPTPELMQQNVLKHFDEMFTPMLFSAHCSAAHLSFAETLDTNNLEKEQALKQVRDGAYGQFIGLLQTAASEDLLSPEQTRRLMQVAAQDAPKFAAAMTLKQREEAVGIAQQLRSALPEDLRAQADKISQDLRQAKCSKLCSL